MSKLLRCVWFFAVVSLCLGLLLSGCNAPKNSLSKFNQYFESGDLEQARQFAEKKIKQKDMPRAEDLLWSLQIGSVDRMEKKYAQSNEKFDTCERIMSHFDSQNSGVAHTAGAVAVNENIVPYTGQVYDGVMVNTYKALNFMSIGQFDLARIEFNRALDRQRRAKETFNQEIRKLKDEVRGDKNSENIQKSLDNPDLQQRLQKVYPSLYDFSVYPDFVNPFATYMAGLFFLIEGDYSKSVDLLKESAGMMPENTMILKDLDAVEQQLSTGKAIEPMVWVLFENGLGPIKEEFRIDLPLFIFTDNVRYVGIALPRLTFRQKALPHLEIQSSSPTLKTELAADMDRVIQTEFEKDFKGILTRTIISATTKAVAQYALEKNSGSSLAAVAMAAYNLATTAADVRIWTSLPKDIQVARLPIPEDRRITIAGPGLEAIPIEIEDCNHAIVYVKMINMANRPSIEVMTF